MGHDLIGDHKFSDGIVTGINFSVLNEADTEKISVTSIEAPNEVTDPKLGIPNLSSLCSTCGAKDTKNCEGHFGVIRFPFTILHPYFLSEVAEILNKICPGCKSVRHDLWKRNDAVNRDYKPKGCKYCLGFSSDWYPPMKFKVSSKDLFRKSAIAVEVSDKLPKKLYNKGLSGELPPDYWDFIPKDENQNESCMKPYRRVLSHSQVHHFLEDVDLKFIQEFASRTDSLFLNCFLITPNSHRVTEALHGLSNSPHMVFDERTRAYRKLVDFRGEANELGSRVLECLKLSKLSSDNSSNKVPILSISGSKWFKEVALGKRSDHSFRMVVIGDPKLKLGEIGIPCNIAERLQISEHLNSWNWEKLNDYCNIRLFEKGEAYIRRKGCLQRIRVMDELELGDTVYRSLNDGDVLLINRPPSIHQHSHIALSVKILPMKSVFSINPFVCLPLRGDFDGDCLHGYIPQSIESRAELKELVALNQQLINGQNGRHLLSFSQDSLTAAHLVTEDGIILNRSQMQQLAMFCSCQSLPVPAIVKSSPTNRELWTGKQLFSLILPNDFDYAFHTNGVCISEGELIISDGSGWFRDAVGNFFNDIVMHCQGETLDFLHVAQNVLCEWLSMRGLTVSLSDLYLCSDYHSRKNLVSEVRCGLQEAQQTCLIKQLMVDSCLELLVEGNEGNQSAMILDTVRLCYERQKSAAVSRAYVSAFRQFFRDIQGLVFQYSSTDNALLAMMKAGSKGNVLKLVQHSMCLGLQHSLVTLSFRLPHDLSCAAWNDEKARSAIHGACDAPESAQSFIPYAVIENSFLVGLNPLECFSHSLMNRDSSFSDNADVPGTLNRRLMFFMRDIFFAYDGTVRNAYGNQVVQFRYSVAKEAATCTPSCDAGTPVGSLSACAISEAAYSALDQPVSTLEISPLLNLKNVLECGLRKFSADQTVTLFLSKRLERWIHGFENGALEVKSHLERVLFSDIVSNVMIVFSPPTGSGKHFSPWVCHFHICKEMAWRKNLKVHTIVAALNAQHNRNRGEAKSFLFNMHIPSKDSSCYGGKTRKENIDMFCITVEMFEPSKNSFIQLDTIRDAVIPALLGTIVKGFLEIKKVDILWNDEPVLTKSHNISSGELCLRAHMSEHCNKMKFWSSIMSNCLQIMDFIDWDRSHPDDIHGVFLAYGIDAAFKFFLCRLKSAIADTGKVILPEHLVLFANCLSTTGEFVGLNSRGMARQREEVSVPSPFLQACFSNPSATFIKAAKSGVLDSLQGSVDALAWGKIPSTGTGGHFDIIYSAKGHGISKPEDVYHILGRQIGVQEHNSKIKLRHSAEHILDRYRVHPVFVDGSVLKRCKTLKKISLLRTFISYNDVRKLSHRLKSILYKYPINDHVSESDKDILMMALYFHPQRDEKIGTGVQDIKVGYHMEHKNSRCFLLVRTDGSVEDFSFHKCVLGALDIIAPGRAKSYRLKWLQGP